MSRHNVTYRAAPAALAAQAPLRRCAGPWSLWALGVSVVISGEFSGWNTGLTAGGFGGLLIATIVITVMYLSLAFSLAEMSAAMPHAGAAYSFARTALGPAAGCAAGLAQIIANVMAGAAVVVTLGAYLQSFLTAHGGLSIPEPVWWAGLYVLFVGLNMHGSATTFRVAIALSVTALSALFGFWVVALPAFDLDLALNVPMIQGGTIYLPNGLTGIAWAIPYAIWFYLAIESVPLAAEESERPEAGVPRGLTWGIITLVVAALITFVLNSGVPPGAAQIGASPEPLLAGFTGVLGEGASPALLAAIGIAGQAASFHATIYAYGRAIFALARAGYLPTPLALVRPGRGTPHFALIAGSVIGFLVALTGKLVPEEIGLGTVLISMSVFAAVISYILQMLAFASLRRHHPDMTRPYMSPFGATGAVTALVIAGAALVFMFLDPSLRPGLFGCVTVMTAGLLYFALYARHRLIRSPEEDFALGEASHERDVLEVAHAPPLAPPEVTEPRERR
jgi:ethanolamine permease